MPATPDSLFHLLESLDVTYRNATHAPVMTVDESQALRGAIPGLHSKNLFLKDKKGGLWLVVAEERRAVDLKRLRKRLGVQNLSFGRPELLLEALGIAPGSVTPFALLNDTARRVRLVLDAELAAAAQVSFHPLDNAQTTTVSGAGLLTFVRALDHEPIVLDFAAEGD